MSRLSFSDRPAVLTPDLPCAPPNTPQLRSVHSTPLYTCVQWCTLLYIMYSSVQEGPVAKSAGSPLAYVQCSRQLLDCLVADWPAAATGCTDTRWPPATSHQPPPPRCEHPATDAQTATTLSRHVAHVLPPSAQLAALRLAEVPGAPMGRSAAAGEAGVILTLTRHSSLSLSPL